MFIQVKEQDLVSRGELGDVNYAVGIVLRIEAGRALIGWEYGALEELPLRIVKRIVKH